MYTLCVPAICTDVALLLGCGSEFIFAAQPAQRPNTGNSEGRTRQTPSRHPLPLSSNGPLTEYSDRQLKSPLLHCIKDCSGPAMASPGLQDDVQTF